MADLFSKLNNFRNKNQNNYFVLLSAIFINFVFMSLNANFRAGIIFLVPCVLLFYFFTKNFLFSLFLVFIITTQYTLLAKVYTFQVFAPEEYIYELLPNGIFENFSITLSDLMGVAVLFFFLREAIRSLFGGTRQRRKFQSLFIKIFRSYTALMALTSWVIESLLSIYSSMYFSFYPTFSTILALQISKMILMAFFMVYFFVQNHILQKSFFYVIAGIVLFYSGLGIKQFFTESAPGSVTNDPTFSFVVPEENVLFKRVQGIAGHPNQYAFSVLFFLIVIFPLLAKERRDFSIFIILMALSAIILSQSRVNWVGLALISVLYFLKFKNRMLTTIGKFQLPIYLRLFLFFSIFIAGVVILPRTYLSFLFFAPEGGGALRSQMIQQGYQLLLHSPLFGFGLGMNMKAIRTYIPDSYAISFPFPVHFGFLQLATEIGIVGLFFLILPFFLIVRKYFVFPTKIREGDQNDSILLFSALNCIIMICIEYFFQNAIPRADFLYFGLAVGLGLTAIIHREQTLYETPRSHKKK